MKPRAVHRSPAPHRAIERSGITAVRRLLLAVALCAPHLSNAADRFDHRGAVGLLVGYGMAFKDRVISGHLIEQSSLGAGMVGRSYFGQEQIKTFIDLDARADLAPTFALGPRLGFGVQFEVLPTLGLFAAVAAHAGGGNGLVFGAEAFAGIQFRSYLLE